MSNLRDVFHGVRIQHFEEMSVLKELQCPIFHTSSTILYLH